MKRRSLWAGGLAIAAGLGGAAVSLWRQRAAVPELPADFWTLRFEQPGGGELDFATLRGQPLLLNFWATWCAPCLTEMPLLDAFARRQSDARWNVVGLAIDSPAPVQEFLRRHPVGFRIALAGLAGTDLIRSLGNVEGGLPYTVLIGRSGRPVERKLGALKPLELDRWAGSSV